MAIITITSAIGRMMSLKLSLNARFPAVTIREEAYNTKNIIAILK